MNQKLEEVITFLSMDVPQLINYRLQPELLKGGISLSNSISRTEKYLSDTLPPAQSMEISELTLEFQRVRNLVAKIKESVCVSEKEQEFWQRRFEYIDTVSVDFILFFDKLRSTQNLATRQIH